MHVTKTSFRKTTKAHFRFFEAEVGRWARVLGLSHVRIHVSHEEADCGDAYGWMEGDLYNAVVTIGLARNWEDTVPTREQLSRVALHECLHVVTAELRYKAKERFVDAQEIDRAEHETVRRLENAFLTMKGKRGKP